MIAIDWGTSSFRAYRLDADGAVRDRRAAPRGVLTVAGGAFAEVLDAEIGDWLARERGAVWMSGMIGSRQGWREAPYVPCPADAGAIAADCIEVGWGDGRRAVIVPGLVCRDAGGVPDVMRGEETQILGALDALADASTVCLPGTHSKFATLRGRRVERFATHMTGEVFGALWRHTILGRLGGAETDVDDAAFDAGVARSGDREGLLHHVFGVRARALLGELPPPSLAPYLSGILIGHEIRAAAPQPPVAVIGAAGLARLYGRAFALCGIEARTIAGEPAPQGLRLIATAAEARA